MKLLRFNMRQTILTHRVYMLNLISPFTGINNPLSLVARYSDPW